MTPPAHPPGTTPPGTAGTVTVAEVIARCSGAPEPVVRPADPALADAVSVPALQRREGRGPHIADRRLQPRGHSRSPGNRPRRGVHRAMTAVGVLVAAGALFAGGVLDIPVRDRTILGFGLGPALPTGSTLSGLDAEGYEVTLATVHKLFADGLGPAETRPLPPLPATRPPESGSTSSRTDTPQPSHTGGMPGEPAASATPPSEGEIDSSPPPG